MGFRFAVFFVLGVLLLGGCSGSAGLSPQQQESLVRSSFRLSVWDESLVGGARAEKFSHWVTQTDDGWVTVDINVSGASGLKALYFDLDFEPQLVEPVGVTFTDRIAKPEQRLEQLDLNAPGRIVAGESLRALGSSPGFSGSGRLARVLFRLKR